MVPPNGSQPSSESANPLPTHIDGSRSRFGILVALVPYGILVGMLLLAIIDLRSGISWLPASLHVRDWLVVVFVVVFLLVCANALRSPRRLRRFTKRYPKRPGTLFGLIAVVLFAVLGIVGRSIGDPSGTFTERYQPPLFASSTDESIIECAGREVEGVCHGSVSYPLGSNRHGQDMLEMAILGAGTAFEMAAIVSLIAIPIATVVGVTAAYAGPRLEAALLAYVDLQQVIPAFLIYLGYFLTIGPSQTALIVIFGLFGWGAVSRAVRQEVIKERNEAYLQAAKGAGAGFFYRLRRHILPNVSGGIVTAMTLQIPWLIAAEAALSFLGFGDPGVISWGLMIDQGLQDLGLRSWVLLVPGTTLCLTILAFYFFGDGLREALDPKQS